MKFKLIVVVGLSAAIVACSGQNKESNAPATYTAGAITDNTGTCSGTYPSYWQDPKFSEMYEGQLVSNQAPSGYSGRVFKLSDAYPTAAVDDKTNQPWRTAKFDPMFDPDTDYETKSSLASDYIWQVLKYIQAGNIDSGNVDSDWDVCNNNIRSWYNIPFQTYNVLAGREFTHGLTREAPVGFSMNTSGVALNGTMWAIGYFNETAAYTLGTVWGGDGVAKIPTDNVSFNEGSVVGKPLFTTLNDAGMPMLKNMPSLSANISDPHFCECKPSDGKKKCTMTEESQQCPRSLGDWGPVTLLQFDVAVKDSRAVGTEWVFGTFVADGERKAAVENPWNRISPLGLMWGNSTPPLGQLASTYPASPRINGFDDMVIFWDTVDMLNANGGSDKFAHPGHLGCNSRLDGPADKAYSSCMSCHGSASVADSNIDVPPIAAQFGGLTNECTLPDEFRDPEGDRIDSSGGKATQKIIGEGGPLITFEEIDSIFFASTGASVPYNTTVKQGSTAVNILPGKPFYEGANRNEWISLDYSLQLSISIVQWKQWQKHMLEDGLAAEERIHTAKLPRR